MSKRSFKATGAYRLVCSTVLLNLFFIVFFGTSASAADIAPRSLMYAGFNNGNITNDGYSFNSLDAVFDSKGKIDQGLYVVSSLWPGHTFLSTPQPIIQSQRGSIAFWVKVDAMDPVESAISVVLGPALIRVNATPGTNGRLTIFIDFDGAGPGGGARRCT